MSEKRALVGNAADPKQVAEADKTERRGRMREIDDLKAILELPQGRRFLWRILGHAGVNQTVLGVNDARTNFNAGRQDVGHFVFGEIVEAAPQRYIDMMRENQKENE
jgi:hypothetical protein